MRRIERRLADPKAHSSYSVYYMTRLSSYPVIPSGKCPVVSYGGADHMPGLVLILSQTSTVLSVGTVNPLAAHYRRLVCRTVNIVSSRHTQEGNGQKTPWKGVQIHFPCRSRSQKDKTLRAPRGSPGTHSLPAAVSEVMFVKSCVVDKSRCPACPPTLSTVAGAARTVKQLKQLAFWLVSAL